MRPRAEGDHFTLDRRTLLLIWVAGWSAVLVIFVGSIWVQFALQGRSFFAEWHYAPRMISRVLIGAVLSIGVFALFRRYVDPAHNLAIRLSRYLPIGVAYWLTWSALSAVLDVALWPGRFETLGAALAPAVSSWAFDALLIFAVMAILYEAMFNMRRVSLEETRTARYEAELSRAKTAALAAQLDPHFLFNTLHVASGLMRRDVGAARSVLGDLRKLLEESFRRENRRMVQLEEELRLVERYLRIQRARFGDRLDVRFEIDPATTGALVPPLLVQPLVENAIQHGIARQRTGGLIRIAAGRSADQIAIVVENTASTRTVSGQTQSTERIGLGGVRARLRSVFGDAARLEVREEPGTFTVTVSLPAVEWDTEVPGESNQPPDESGDAEGAEGGDAAELPGWDGVRAAPSRPWGWRRWVAVGMLAWLWVIIHYQLFVGFRRMAMGAPFYTSWMQFGSASVQFLVGGLLTPLVVLFLWRIRKRIPRLPLVAALYALVGGAFWVTWTVIAYFVVPFVADVRTMPLGSLLTRTAFVSLSLYAVIALIVEATWQLRMARDRAMKAAALRADLLAAETAALRSKVSPRLLFDSLALASALMGKDVRAARKVLSDLSELLRASLGREGDSFVSLEEELDHLRSVLDIHVGRGRGHAPVELELTGGAGERMVPRLVLQPLAGELARTAVEDCGEPGRIVIRGEPAGPDHVRLLAGIQCEEDAAGAVPVRLSSADLDQVRQWLTTAYGFDADVRAWTTQTGECLLEFIAPPGAFPAPSPTGSGSADGAT